MLYVVRVFPKAEKYIKCNPYILQMYKIISMHWKYGVKKSVTKNINAKNIKLLTHMSFIYFASICLGNENWLNTLKNCDKPYYGRINRNMKMVRKGSDV